MLPTTVDMQYRGFKACTGFRTYLAPPLLTNSNTDDIANLKTLIDRGRVHTLLLLDC